MAETPSTMLPLGTKAPDFTLTDAVSGRKFSLKDFSGAQALVVMFICNHCPFVIHVRDEIGRIARDYKAKGVAFAAINANSEESHPQDGPPHMKQLAEELGWDFPFLFDSTQETAKAYRAACTPDFFVFDKNLALVYRGRLDRSRPGNNEAVDGCDLRAALDAVLSGREVSGEQFASMGCNIKWAAGNEPSYFA